jgi:hypothetical protein
VASTLLAQADGTTALVLLMGGLSPSERRRVGRAVRRLAALGLLRRKTWFLQGPGCREAEAIEYTNPSVEELSTITKWIWSEDRAAACPRERSA